MALATLAVAAFIAAAPAGAAPTTPTAAVTSAFAGLDDVASGEFEPPDVQVAAGPGWVVQMVNVAERIWRTGGGAAPQVVLTQTLSSLFRSGNDLLTDPRIEYDAPSGRWFSSVSDVDAGGVLLAVSQTNDPTGAWSVYAFHAPGCADQPRLGIADGVIVLGADIFSSCDSNSVPFEGGELWIVNKQEALAGAASVSSTTYGPDASFSSFAPVQSLSSTSTEYVVAVDNPSSSVVHLLTVDGIPPAAVRVQPVASIGITPLQQPPPAQQPSSEPVATNDDRILDSVWENGRLWFSADTGCIPAGDSVQRACGRIAEVSTAKRTLAWDTNLGVPGAQVFFPALRPDSAGNLVVVYGESSDTIHPQLVAVGRAPDGRMTAPVVIAPSAGPHQGKRFGDYFGAARDPADPTLVWVSGEIGSNVSNGSIGWNTMIASVRLTVPAVIVLPARLRALASKGRSGSIVRLGFAALDDGSNVRAQVTVSTTRGTVVFRTTTSMPTLQAGNVYAARWPTAKSRVGTFRFCVRSLTAAGGKSAQSCASVTVRK
jgi:hypothetical protein